ncbi:MAG: Peroxiredoxin [Chthonomonadales bacterium]|nr:Peroxiredoxin [Chthonomonadales bacterium]
MIKFRHRYPTRIGLPLMGLATLTAVAAWGLGPNSGVRSAHKSIVSAKKVVSKLAFNDLTGKAYTAQDIAAHKASVFLFISGQCPVSNVYTPRMNALAATYGARDVQVFAIYSDRQESASDIMRHAKEHGLTFPIVKDTTNRLADTLGAQMTPEAIVVDASGAVRYRGRIDDNAVATRVSARDLNAALDAVLDGKPVAHPEMLAIGCAIRRNAAPVPAKPGVPTYARDIAPILRTKCEGCHRPGEVAPFSLQTYTQASAWSADIKRYTAAGQMPPWKPASGYGDFQEADVHTLSETERNTIAKWADNGAPLGDLKQMPAPRKFVQGWQLGEPDMVIAPEKAYHLSADGEDVYRNFVVKSNFTEDRYLSAVEVRPGNAAIVHHVVAYIDSSHQGDQYASEKLEAATTDGQPGYTSFGGPGFIPTGLMGAWAPGNNPHFLPQGVGTRVPKGARIVMQVHYHKDGKPETDQTRFGLHFCKGSVQKEVANAFAVNVGFQIPPGNPHYETRGTLPVSEDEHLLAVMPHMHLLGTEMKVWATLPDGSEKPLVWIKEWDFNWQGTYYFKEPIALPKGAAVHLTAYYDNSAKNTRNPLKDHPRTVTWGEQTTDEMCVAFFFTTKDAQKLNVQSSVPPKQTAGVR